MVGFLIITHHELAGALLAAARMLGADTGHMRAVGLRAEEGPEAFLMRVEQAVKEADTGDGVVALADLFGGTPFHTVFRIAQQRDVSVVTGVNLPMILAAAFELDGMQSREEAAKALCELAAGQIRVYGKVV